LSRVVDGFVGEAFTMRFMYLPGFWLPGPVRGALGGFFRRAWT
jgi:hypothetical protein